MNQLADKPFVLLGVNTDKDLDSIRKIVEEKDLNWRSFWSGEKGTSGPIPKKWQIKAWPTIFILDGEGKIRFKGNGGKELDQTIVRLMAEMGHQIEIDSDPEAAEKEDEGKSNSDGK